MSEPRRGGVDAVGDLVKVAFLIRLFALAVAGIGLLGRELTADVLVAVLLMAATSFIGLSQPAALDLVRRHPILAMLDVVLVMAVVVILGVSSPLTLGALSTALLVGLLLPGRVAALLVATMVVCQVLTALGTRGTPARDFFPLFGEPVALVSLAAIGLTIRRLLLEQERAQAEVALAHRAMATVEERARLAREMHDSLAKSLQGIAMAAASLPLWLSRDQERARTEAAALAEGARRAAEQARALLVQMRLDDPRRPFEDVLAEVVRGWGEQHAHDVVPDLEHVTLSTGVRHEALAAVLEILENVRRHAPGAPVRVVLRRCGPTAQLSVHDEGPGFDVASLPQRESDGHFGLVGVNERMQAVGGSAHLVSVPAAGTSVTLVVPVADTGPVPASLPLTRPAPAGQGT